jgi:HAMP domain-containing protein
VSVRIDDPTNNDSLGVMKTVLGITLIQGVTDTAAGGIAKSKITVLNDAGRLIADTDSEHARRRIMNEKVNLKATGGPIMAAAYGKDQSGYALVDEVGDLARDFERMRESVEVAMRRMRGG